MSEIIKICRKHGNLTLSEINKSGTTHGTLRYKCKKCQKELHHKNYLKNIDKINAKNIKWKKENLLRVRELNKKVKNKAHSIEFMETNYNDKLLIEGKTKK